jgi:putative ABC transport system permease protein
MLIILYNKDEASYDRFHKNVDNIYRSPYNNSILPENWVQRAELPEWVPGPTFKREIPEVKEFVRMVDDRWSVKIGTEIYEQYAFKVDENFFSVFSFPMIAGDPATALADIHSVVLSEEVAKKFFGKENAIGKTLELPSGENGAFEVFTVSGIVPKSPQNSSIKITMLLPLKLSERNNGGDKEWLNFYLNTFVVLHLEPTSKLLKPNLKKYMRQTQSNKSPMQ